MLYDIFNFFSRNISQNFKKTVTEEKMKFLEEIRIRNHQNIILNYNEYDSLNSLFEHLRLLLEA